VQRVFPRQGLQLGDELDRPPPREVRRHPVVQDRDPLLLQAGDLAGHAGLVGEVRERRAPPLLERRGQHGRRLPRVGDQQAPAAGGELGEPQPIELVRRDPQHVATTVADRRSVPTTLRRFDT
jgi:hypothetical protein